MMKPLFYICTVIMGLISTFASYAETDKKSFKNYAVPVSDPVANAMIKAHQDLGIDLYEFLYLSSCPVHSRETVRLVKDHDKTWRLEYVALPENSYLVFLLLYRTEGSRMNNDGEKPLDSKQLAEVLKTDLKNSHSFEADLKKLRKVELMQKEISTRIWSLEGDGKE